MQIIQCNDAVSIPDSRPPNHVLVLCECELGTPCSARDVLLSLPVQTYVNCTNMTLNYCCVNDDIRTPARPVRRAALVVRGCSCRCENFCISSAHGPATPTLRDAVYRPSSTTQGQVCVDTGILDPIICALAALRERSTRPFPIQHSKAMALRVFHGQEMMYLPNAS
jgi:hypothetical protein